MPPILGYWNIRGLAQPIRLMLAYTETAFEDKKYSYGPPPEYTRRAWFDEKYTLDLDFPNLPYYIDGDTKLTQSLVIMRYLARKHKLDAESEQEKIRLDVTEQQLADLRMGFSSMCYSPEFEKLKEEYLKGLPAVLRQFDNFLGKNKWFAGEKLTYVDFCVYEILDHHRMLVPDCLDDYKTLLGFMTQFEKLPTIQKYMQSEDFMSWPLNGDMAKFGSKSSKPA